MMPSLLSYLAVVLVIVMVAYSGPLATISCELRQAWKGATVTVDLGAQVWLV